MPPAVESPLGPYRLLSVIGSGGMGKVYRARDTRLNRDVAVKILAVSDADEEARRRFEQEAQAISAINHPNILTIHDAGHDDERGLFIVTELIEGESLREVLRRGPLPMRQVLEYGIQIAEGLAAAHDEGIIHRDLKPENVMITRDGRVKILDFGIAKVEETFSDSARTLSDEATLPGVLVGTTAYMSPEQARGGRVSYFADQFALGAILHEMATGTAVFKRDTPLATLSAVLTDEPPELQVGSAPFRWLAKRCLHKEPDHRYGSTADVVRELRNIREHLTEEIATAPPAAVMPRGRRWRAWPAWFAVGAVAFGALGFAVARLSAPSGTSVADAQFVPFATSEAMEVSPAWSPNGRSVAYSAAVGGVFQIFVRGVGGIAPTQLTMSADDCMSPFWSPDSGRVYYLSRNALWAVGATGGSPEQVLENVAHADLAPDGRTFAAIRGMTGTNTYALWVGEANALKPVSERRFLPWSYVRFSPDGKKIGAWLTLADGRSEFLLVDPRGGSAETALGALASSAMAREFAWMPDSRRIVFSDRSGLSTGSHLFVADVRSGALERVTNGVSSEFSPSVAPNGDRIAFAAVGLDYDVVRVGLDGRIVDMLSSTRFEVSPTITKDGVQAYVTDRNGRPELWMGDRAVVTPDAFGSDKPGFLFDAVFSPDGRRIAYRVSGANDEAIWVSPVSGDPPVRLGREPGGAFQRGPSWSPDGNEIVYYSMRGGRYVLVRARVGGDEAPRVVAEDAGTYPRWSPKGDWIAAVGSAEGLTLVKPDGSGRRVLGSGTWLLHGWSGDGSRIYGVKRNGARMALVSVDVGSGAESILADLGAYPAGFRYGESIGMLPLRGFSMAADGNGFVTSMLRATGDVWLMTLR